MYVCHLRSPIRGGYCGICTVATNSNARSRPADQSRRLTATTPSELLLLDMHMCPSTLAVVTLFFEGWSGLARLPTMVSKTLDVALPELNSVVIASLALMWCY